MVRGAPAQPSHAELMTALETLNTRLALQSERLNQGSERFMSIEEKLQSIAEALEPIPDMQKDIAATKEIVEAWNAVKTGGKFVTWLGAVAAALAAIWVVAVNLLKHMR